ncbi:MAG: hypothetical protein JWN32_4265 [Solirubrobacterales bacterium]|nr:hypothetical protein [Solirubrobacterales bacterium]
MSSETLKLISIPVFTGVIGYIINWSGVWMLFHPLEFHGFRLPGLAPLARLLPRKLQEIPGIMHGGVGWQGIIPSRASKMASIAVDKGIAKLGSPGEFYQQLEPDKIAEHIITSSQRDIHDVVERIMRRDHARLWADLPPRVREAVHARVQQQLPDIVREVTDEIGTNIDQLLDVKLMTIDHLEKNPELVNRIFLDVGKRELTLMIRFGFVFGFALGIPVAVVTHFVPQWWLLPVLGVVVGWTTNLLGMKLIFEPVEPTGWGPIKMHGLFLRRKHEVAEIYAKIIAEDVVTLTNIGTALLHGPRADRTRRMLKDALRPAVDRATGPARTAVRVAMGAREYDSIRESVATEAVEYTVTPFSDVDFNRAQSERVRTLLAARMREMPYTDFVEMLRSAIKEDEWMLYAHGAVLGFGAGLVHLAIFGV